MRIFLIHVMVYYLPYGLLVIQQLVEIMNREEEIYLGTNIAIVIQVESIVEKLPLVLLLHAVLFYQKTLAKNIGNGMGVFNQWHR